VDFPVLGILAIDFTLITYFGEERTPTVQSREHRGTQYAFFLATVYLCHRGMRFTLHAMPVDSFTRKEDVVRKELDRKKREAREQGKSEPTVRNVLVNCRYSARRRELLPDSTLRRLCSRFPKL